MKLKLKVVAKDFHRLETLRNDLGSRFKQGLVLYSENDIISFGKGYY